MSKTPKDQRIPIMMSDSEVDAIDTWRFANKIATRAEAVRRLCQIALFVDSGEKSLLQTLQNSRDGMQKVPEDILLTRLLLTTMMLKTGNKERGGIPSGIDMQRFATEVMADRDGIETLRKAFLEIAERATRRTDGVQSSGASDEN